MQAIDRSSLEPEWRKAFEWVEANVGPIVAGERQARWRPCWYLDVEKDGQSLPLYFRGDRGESDHGVYPLEHEMRVLQLLEEEGLPVPHVYGFCDEPRGIVMERKPIGERPAECPSEGPLDQALGRAPTPTCPTRSDRQTPADPSAPHTARSRTPRGPPACRPPGRGLAPATCTAPCP